jgi:hypothetical protein
MGLFRVLVGFPRRDTEEGGQLVFLLCPGGIYLGQLCWFCEIC